MKTPLSIANHYIAVFDTESDTTTGAMTSWQYAPVISDPSTLEYSDAYMSRCTSTAEGMEAFEEFIKSNFKPNDKIILYTHNFAWDITFICNFLLKNKQYTYTDNKKLQPNQFNTLITDMGQVFFLSYLIPVTTKRGKEKYIEVKFQDSLKIIPFSLKDAGSEKAYNTKFKKIEGENYDTTLSDKYCLHDVLCLSELITIQINEGIDPVHTLSLASHCLKTFKKRFYNYSPLAKNYLDNFYTDDFNKDKKLPDVQKVYRHFFPRLDHKFKYAVDTSEYAVKSLDAYVRAAYRGGLTYCNPDTANTIFISKWFYDKAKDQPYMKEILATNNYRIVNYISHIDVHSMYPSKCMCGWRNYKTFPLGKPMICPGAPSSYTVQQFNEHKEHFAVRFSCKFRIKDRLHSFPSIQIKYFLFPQNDWLESSLIGDTDVQTTMTLTDVEFMDFINRYDVYDINFIDHAIFKAYSCTDIFDCYMGYYYPMKAAAKDFVHKQTAKSMQNNLTGKFGSNVQSFIKKPVIKDGKVEYQVEKVDADGEVRTKDTEYVPIVTWITAYGRLTLLDMMDEASNDWSTGSQYITGDTDSGFIASDKPFIPSLGITKSDINTFGYEHTPDQIAMFCATRQKTYMMVLNDGTFVLKVAGMTQEQKERFVETSTNPIVDFAKDNINVVGGKLIKQSTTDGAVLVDTDFKVDNKPKKKVDEKKLQEKLENKFNAEPKNVTELAEKIKWDEIYREKMRLLFIQCNSNKNEFERKLGYPINYGIIAKL